MNSQLQSRLTIISLLLYLFATGCSTVPDRTVPGMPMLKVERKTADNYAIAVNPEHPADMQSPGMNDMDALTASEPQEIPGGGNSTGEGKIESGEIVISIKIFKKDQPDERLSIRDYQNAVVTIHTTAGHGSGFIITEDGYILTNQHVVGAAKFVNIALATGREVKGEVIRTDAVGDVALIRLEKDVYPYVFLGNSSLLAIGEEVYAIGSPSEEELSQTVTNGIVSNFRMEKGFRYIQSDVLVHGGDSGGPLVSLHNGVVGICAAGHSFPDGDSGRGLNQFIPIEDAITMLNINGEEISIENILGTI